MRFLGKHSVIAPQANSLCYKRAACVSPTITKVRTILVTWKLSFQEFVSFAMGFRHRSNSEKKKRPANGVLLFCSEDRKFPYIPSAPSTISQHRDESGSVGKPNLPSLVERSKLTSMVQLYSPHRHSIFFQDT